MDVAIAKQNIDNDGITKLTQNVRLSSCLKVASMNSEMCRVWLLHFRFFFISVSLGLEICNYLKNV